MSQFCYVNILIFTSLSAMLHNQGHPQSVGEKYCQNREQFKRFQQLQGYLPLGLLPLLYFPIDFVFENELDVKDVAFEDNSRITCKSKRVNIFATNDLLFDKTMVTYSKPPNHIWA